MHAAVVSLLFASLALPQWLNAGGFRASETRTWHARSQAVCENNAWMMTGVNLLGQGPLPPEGAQRNRSMAAQDALEPQHAQKTREQLREERRLEKQRIRAEYDALPEAELSTRLEACGQTKQPGEARPFEYLRVFHALERRLRAGQLSSPVATRGRQSRLNATSGCGPSAASTFASSDWIQRRFSR